MSLLSKLLNFYIDSSLHVALAVISFLLITYLDFDLQINPWVICFTFFSTILAYTVVKYLSLIKKNRFKLSLKFRLIFFLATVSVIPISLSMFHFGNEVILFISALGLLTALYVLPFLPKAKNLRDVSGLKIFIIALVWTGATVILPLFSAEFDKSWLDDELLFYTLSRFLLIIALIIPFEIRDLRLDDIYLKTLPQVFGVFKTKLIAVGIVILSMLLLYLASVDTYIYVFIHLLIIVLIVGSKRRDAFLYTTLLVEGVPVLWVLIKYFSS